MGYVITAWTSDHRDERALLSVVVRSLLSAHAVPTGYLTEGLDGLEPPSLVMARAGEDHMDVLKALEGQVKPGLNVVLTTEFDAGVSYPAGPPVGRIEIAANRIGKNRADRHRRVAGEIEDAESIGAIGPVVRSPGDATRDDPAGLFLLRAVEGDEIVVETDPPLTAAVPSAGGIRMG